MSKKILITGGMGFIGSHIAEMALDKNHEVFLLDNGSTGRQSNIAQALLRGAKLIPGDILDRELLSKVCVGVDTIFHLAARISVAESMEKPTDYVRTNSEGTLNVLEAAKCSGVKNFVLSSSAAIYGDNPIVPKKETMLPEPKSPYAVTKLDGEYYCSMYRKVYGLNAIALRYFNVFGERQDPNSAYAAAVPIFIHKALQGEDITIFGDGHQTRDFIYVKDIAAANFLAAERGGEAKSEVFNVCLGEKLEINTLAQMIIDITGSRSKLVHLEARSGDIKHSMGSNEKITQILGFKSGLEFKKGLEKTIAFFQKN